MTKGLAAIAILCTNLWSTTGANLQEQKQKSTETSAQSVNQVVQWNRILLSIVRIQGAQRPRLGRQLADFVLENFLAPREKGPGESEDQ